MDWTGSSFTKEQFEAVMAIDPAKVRQQVAANDTYLKDTIGHTSPALLAVSQEILKHCE